MVWNFRNLEVWKVSFGLIKKVYGLTSKFPRDEIYGLTSQLRRATVSISSNIAEGCGRRTSKDFVSFLYNALGSTKEVESQLLAAGELGYLDDGEVDELVKELGRVGMMLRGLIGHVSEKGIR
ncbi:four helix bundle protein [archaeon]|mgnify:CR=1 FL=1|jgi:four helix bundle protein|nr:four helix bundle protein [archaeon]MBT7128692.1 four helix bundle protein [archaeon]